MKLKFKLRGDALRACIGLREAEIVASRPMRGASRGGKKYWWHVEMKEPVEVMIVLLAQELASQASRILQLEYEMQRLGTGFPHSYRVREARRSPIADKFPGTVVNEEVSTECARALTATSDANDGPAS